MILFVVFLCAIAVEGLNEGETCTIEGIAGVCTNIKECPAAQEDIRNKKKPQICYFGDKVPIVCCVQSATTSTTTKRAAVSPTTESTTHPHNVNVGDEAGHGCEPISPSLTSKPTGQKAWDKCLEYQEKLVFPCVQDPGSPGGVIRKNRCNHDADDPIVGRKPAAVKEFPHMAMLGYGRNPENLEWLSCGGSLISDKFILTAGHCVTPDWIVFMLDSEGTIVANDVKVHDSKQNIQRVAKRFNNTEGGTVTHVQLGTLGRSSMPDQYRYKVKRVVKHPQYNSSYKYHDIALLELARRVPLDEFTVPACLHTGAPMNDSQAVASGWGLTSYNRKKFDELQKITLHKVEAPECAMAYKSDELKKNGLDENSQICFGDRKPVDTCRTGDGSPVQIKTKEIACMYTILGVTTSAILCTSPGIYTRVAHYLDWIEKTVWP